MRYAILAVLFLLAMSMSVASADYYMVTITRKDTNWYKVENIQDMYLRTQFCFEYTFWEECILESDGYLMRVKINETWYTVEGLYTKFTI